uniref:Uncharacterized protein n=1 Tax=Quercus lobata TaxID=97700 RepID=A0A7N2MH22_QUELO
MNVVMIGCGGVFHVECQLLLELNLHGSGSNNIIFMASKHGKKVYLTATPQCTFPDHLVGNALEIGKIMLGLNFTTHHASTVQAICLTLKILGSSGLSDIPATRIF